MERAHRDAEASLSIFLIAVDEPSAYGIAQLDEDNRIVRFVEKPPAGEAPSRWANAGVWLFEPDVLDLIPSGRRSMVETELFPQLIEAGKRLQGYPADCFWVDIGTPERYLAVQLRLLEEPALHILPLDTWPGTPLLRAEAPGGTPPVISPDAHIRGPVLLGGGVEIGPGAEIIGPAVLGSGCRVGAATWLERSVLWDGVDLGRGASVRESVLADGCRIGERSDLRSVFAGAGVIIAADRALSGVLLEPAIKPSSRKK